MLVKIETKEMCNDTFLLIVVKQLQKEEHIWNKSINAVPFLTLGFIALMNMFYNWSSQNE